MKSVFVLAMLVSLLAFSSDPSKTQLKVPTLHFDKNPLVDRILCEGRETPENAAEIRQQALVKLPEQIDFWKQHGQRYFDVLFNKFGKGFKRKELTAAISACKFFSMSRPFFILDLYVSTQDGPEFGQADLNNHFLQLVIHELLHIYVDDNLKENSDILARYSEEHPTTLDHIHLNALWLHMVREIDGEEAANKIRDFFLNSPADRYRRAMEILVNDLEEADVLAEIGN